MAGKSDVLTLFEREPVAGTSEFRESGIIDMRRKARAESLVFHVYRTGGVTTTAEMVGTWSGSAVRDTDFAFVFGATDAILINTATPVPSYLITLDAMTAITLPDFHVPYIKFQFIVINGEADCVLSAYLYLREKFE